MSEHTPGPWEPRDDGYVVRIKAGKFIVAQLPVRRVTLVEQNAANADLIAAAPDMKDALYVAYSALVRLGMTPEDGPIQVIEAALEKADGK